MAYNESMADRVRIALGDEADVVEKPMFGGLCFMVNGKMCLCVAAEGLLCRIGALPAAEAVEWPGCRQMMNGRRQMKDFVYVDESIVRNPKQLHYWIDLCLQYNPLAKAAKK